MKNKKGLNSGWKTMPFPFERIHQALTPQLQSQLSLSKAIISWPWWQQNSHAFHDEKR